MTQSVNSDSITAELCITYSTVDYLVVATGVLTVGSHVVLNDGLACGVTLSGNLIRHIAIATDGAGVGGVTLIGTSRSSYVCVVLVTQSGNNLLRNENLVTDGAVLTLGQTGVHTVGSHSGINDLGVRQSVQYLGLKVVTVGTVSSRFTRILAGSRGDGLPLAHGVTDRNGAGFNDRSDGGI